MPFIDAMRFMTIDSYNFRKAMRSHCADSYLHSRGNPPPHPATFRAINCDPNVPKTLNNLFYIIQSTTKYDSAAQSHSTVSGSRYPHSTHPIRPTRASRPSPRSATDGMLARAHELTWLRAGSPLAGFAVIDGRNSLRSIVCGGGRARRQGGGLCPGL
jgi:hypothetical protein